MTARAERAGRADPSPVTGLGPGLAAAVAALGRWPARGAAAVAGAVSVLAFAPFHLWPVMFVTLPVLVWLLDGCCAPMGGGRFERRIGQAALVGWCFGFGFFLAGLYWIGHAFLVEAERFAWLMPFAVALMPAGLALFFAAAAALACVLWRPGVARICALALALTVSEWLRGHILTGFPWNTLGYAVTAGEAMMQWASLVGVHGLTWFAVLAFAAPAALWARPGMALETRAGRLALPVAAALVLSGAAAWGAVRLDGAGQELVDGVRLRIVQPNILQSEKWKDGNQVRVFQTYLDLSAYGSSGRPLDEVTHLVWPESATPFLLADSPEALAALSDLMPDGLTFLTGALRLEEDQDGRRVYNSIFVMDSDASLLSVYDKVHLVPFGEYLPFQETLEALGIAQLTGVPGGFTAGEGPRHMQAPGLPDFAPLVCYEAIFPLAVRAPGAEPRWMLNVTNDGWFGLSTGPHQHLHQARVRAVEEGLPIVRAANTGVSAVIDPYGRLLAHLPLGVGGAIDVGLPAAAPRPPFARWGRAIEGAIFALALGAWFAAARRVRKRRRA